MGVFFRVLSWFRQSVPEVTKIEYLKGTTETV